MRHVPITESSSILTDDNLDHSSLVCSRRAQRCWRLRTHDFRYCAVLLPGVGLGTTRLLLYQLLHNLAMR